MRYALPILLAYLAAAPLTDLVSLDLTKTAWTNILTYVWIMFAWLAWLVILSAAVSIVAAVVAFFER